MDTSHPSRSKGKRPSLRGKSGAPAKDAYLISLAIKEDAVPLGVSRGKETVLNERGKALAACWAELERVRPGLQPDLVQVGPRQLQGIMKLAPQGSDKLSLSEAVRLFKVLSSLRLAQIAKVAAGPHNLPATEAAALPARSPSALWKKGYSERQIIGASEMSEARKALRSASRRPTGRAGV